MTDISKCDGWIRNVLCVNRDNCLRYTIKADDLLQSWLTPSMKHNGDCKHFLQNYEQEKAKPSREDN
jgi:hypothetical protein